MFLLSFFSLITAILSSSNGYDNIHCTSEWECAEEVFEYDTNVFCEGYQSCIDSEFSNYGKVRCRGDESCKNSYISYPESLTCSGYKGCENTRIVMDSNAYCTGVAGCMFAEVVCRDCDIRCGYYGCLGTSGISDYDYHYENTTNLTSNQEIECTSRGACMYAYAQANDINCDAEYGCYKSHITAYESIDCGNYAACYGSNIELGAAVNYMDCDDEYACARADIISQNYDDEYLEIVGNEKYSFLGSYIQVNASELIVSSSGYESLYDTYFVTGEGTYAVFNFSGNTSAEYVKIECHAECVVNCGYDSCYWNFIWCANDLGCNIVINCDNPGYYDCFWEYNPNEVTHQKLKQEMALKKTVIATQTLNVEEVIENEIKLLMIPDENESIEIKKSSRRKKDENMMPILVVISVVSTIGFMYYFIKHQHNQKDDYQPL